MQQQPEATPSIQARLGKSIKGPVALDKLNKRADASVIALLMMEALTVKQVAERLKRSEYVVHVLVTVWHDLGLVYIHGYADRVEGGRGRKPVQWKWQPSPFYHKDATFETLRETQRRERQAKEQHALRLMGLGFEVEECMRTAGLNPADRACKGRLDAAHLARPPVSNRAKEDMRFALAS